MSTAANRRVALDADIASPCVSICEMDAATGLCRGCLRTLDEIAAWSVLDAEGKRRVLAALPARRTVHGGSAA
jgi:predicted Fe-S protein YdhL (DUF1289 family)